MSKRDGNVKEHTIDIADIDDLDQDRLSREIEDVLLEYTESHDGPGIRPADDEPVGPARSSPADQRRIEDLERELEMTRNERQMIHERMLRIAAELDNYKKRVQRDREQMVAWASEELVRDLLPVADDLERALEGSRRVLGVAVGTSTHPVIEGMELIYRQFLKVLQKQGVERIPALGQPFDPALHDAAQMVQTADHPNNQVVRELKPGYMLKGRLLRPAMVVVASNPGGPEAREVTDAALTPADEPVEGEIIEAAELAEEDEGQG